MIKAFWRVDAGFPIHPDLFAQTDFHLFCWHYDLPLNTLICSLLFSKC